MTEYRARHLFTFTILVSMLLTLASAALVSVPAARAADESTYTSTKTIPVPPASRYAGAGGGDGWNVALENGFVYNVFHHNSSFVVACHLETDASACWSPRTIVDDAGNHFATGSHSGAWIDTTDLPRLYAFATRTSDGSVGVVCVDLLAIGLDGGEPFCGFTELVGGTGTVGESLVSAPVKVGTRHYAVAFRQSGEPGQVVCVDDVTRQACEGQPWSLQPGATVAYMSTWPVPSVAGVGDRIYAPLQLDGGDVLACWDPEAAGACAGGWPAPIPTGIASQSGSAVPLLDRFGQAVGVCVGAGAWSCFAPDGVPVDIPEGMDQALTRSSGWNAGYVVFGSRLLVPNGNMDRVECFDAAANSSCIGFPLSVSGANLVYALTPDPLRGGCVWLNADSGTSQIQNFDAFTGGVCGDGPTRVLASQFVVGSETCQPTTYQSLEVLSPDPSGYSAGYVEFLDTSGNPLPLESRVLDQGSIDLTTASALVDGGLPQFLITLEDSSPSEVTVRLTWTSTSDNSCLDLGAEVVGGESLDGCPDAYFVALQGSGEYYTSQRGLENSPTLQTVYRAMQDHLLGQEIEVRTVNYPARSVDLLPGQLERYMTGSRAGTGQLPGLLRGLSLECPAAPITIAGYSQGALVVHMALEKLRFDRDSDLNDLIAGVALVADPGRAGSDIPNVGTAPNGGTGICRAFVKGCPNGWTGIPKQFHARTVQMCNTDDLVCDTNLRRIEEGKEVHVQYASDGATRNVGMFLAERVLEEKWSSGGGGGGW